MKLIDYFVFRYYNFYHDQFPTYYTILGLTTTIWSVICIVINSIELLAGKKMINLSTNTGLWILALFILIPFLMYWLYFPSGRHKSISFKETKKERITRGIIIISLQVCLFIGVMTIYSIRYKFFGDIPMKL